MAVHGQNSSTMLRHDIAELEGKRFHRDKFVAKSNAGDSYDWKYAECYWNIDPWVKYISGRVEHTVDILDLMDTIFFDFSIALSVNGVQWNNQTIGWFFKDPITLAIVFPEKVQGIQKIKIHYEGTPVESSYLSFVQSFHGMEPEIYTLSEPFGARDWWPCKQSMNDKLDSIFIEITVPEGQKAGSNGKLEYVTTQSDGTVKYGWKHRYPIPAYLVSIAVTNYAEFTQTVAVGDIEIPILNYVYPERLELEMERAEKLPDLMKLYSEKFGLYPYANEKYGHCQSSIPGGMEHSTMSTMANLNYELMAHELAHQWFGNKVTCGSWGDIWLNEGFATYLTGLAHEFLGTEEDWKSWKDKIQQSVKSIPDGAVAIKDTTNRNEIFDGRLTYNKAAYLLHMIRWIIGDEQFFKACNNYLNDPNLAFGYARTDDLIAHFEYVSDINLSTFMQNWYYGEGYPTYALSWTPAEIGVAFTINQTTSHASVPFYEMPVPIQFIGNNRDTIITVQHSFSGQSYYLVPGFEVLEVVVDPDLWILANKNVNLDPDAEIDIYEIKLFPNPVLGNTLNISIRNPAFHAQSWEIFDVAGKKIISQQPTQGVRNSFEINVGQLAPGMYVLRLKNGNRFKSKSFVIKGKQ